MAVSVSWNSTFRDRVRLLAGIEQEELDNTTMDILANIAAEWFAENVGSTFVLNDNNTYDNAVMFYTCYLLKRKLGSLMSFKPIYSFTNIHC